MSRKRSGDVTSAREVADFYGLPFEITAKTLQQLKNTGLIQSEQGARGGYTLKRRLDEVNLAEFMELLEGPQTVVPCTSTKSEKSSKQAGPCDYHGRCEISGLM